MKKNANGVVIHKGKTIGGNPCKTYFLLLEEGGEKVLWINTLVLIENADGVSGTFGNKLVYVYKNKSLFMRIYAIKLDTLSLYFKFMAEEYSK